jgi:WD40 repeat protein
MAITAAGKEGKIILLDPNTGKESGELMDSSYRPGSPNLSYRSWSFSPDGKFLAVAVRHRQFNTPQDPRIPPAVQVWDLTSRKVVVTLKENKGYEAIGSVAFSRDGRLFATGGQDRTLRLYDVATWRELRTLRGHSDDVNSLSFSPDGKLLAALNFGLRDGGHKQRIVKLWDPATAEERGDLRGHTAAVTDVAFSPDGTQLATSSWDHTAKIWELTAAQDADSLYQGPEVVEAFAASANGRYLAWGLGHRFKSSGFITLFDLPSRQTIRRIEFHAVDLALSRDGRWLAARGAASSRNEVRVWDTQSGTQSLNLGTANWGKDNLAFSDDGKRLAVGKEGNILVWDLPSGQLAFTLEEGVPVFTLSISPDGRWLASGAGPRVNLWDLRKRAVHHTFSLPAPAYGINALAFSPDSQRLVCADRTPDAHTAIVNSQIRVWDTSSFEERLSIAGHTDAVGGVAFSPDGERLATASLDRRVTIWDARLGQHMLTLQGHEGGVNWVFFTPDGQYLITADTIIPNTRSPTMWWTSATRYSVKLWDARPWRE